MPAILIQAGIDGYHTDLTTESGCHLFDKLRTTDGCTIDAHLVGTGIEHTFYVGQLIDTASNGEGDTELLGYLGNHIGKGLTTLKAGGDIKKHQFVGTSLTIGLAEFHRVASTPKIYEVDALHGLTVLDI